MADFTLSPGAYAYRPLKRGLWGWDVVALQRALQGAGHSLPLWGADGGFGAETDASVKVYQSGHGLVADGIAGILTQRSLAIVNGRVSARNWGVPESLLLGYFEFEGGFQLGNHTAPYADGTRDLGIVQHNGSVLTFGFDTPARIDQLAARVRARRNTYAACGGGLTTARCWELASGHWNRPAHTDFLANPTRWPLPGGLTAAQRAWIEGYIDRVTTYVTEWPA